MRENIEQIHRYAWKIWRRRWIALGVAAAICAAGWSTVATMPDKYESMARVFLDTQSMLRPALKGVTIDSGMESKVVQTSQQTLLSGPNLEKVARDTDLDLGVHTPEAKERLIALLREKIDVTGSSRDNIYVIKYQSSDPELAQRVVSSLLTIFVENTLKKIGGEGWKTKSFLEEQIQEYNIKLLAAEDHLKEFKKKYGSLLPTEAGGYYARIQKARDDLDQAKLLLSEAIQRQESLKFQLSDVSSIVGASTNEAVSALKEQVSGLERQRDALMLQFTDKHPDVIAAKQKIDILEQQQKNELLNPKESNYVGVENPIYQELKIELGKVSAEVGALRARKRELQRKVSELERLVDTIPEVEARYLQLNRDYQNNKKTYDDLVHRLAAIDITIAIGGVDDRQFKIIDPPVVPLVPVGPNRSLFMTLVLLAGLGGGIAFALFLSQVRSTFDSTTELSSGTGLPVYGSISMVWEESRRSKNKTNTIIFSLALLTLFAVYGLVSTIQFWV